MKLSCKHCGQNILSEDINLDRLVAKCWSCHAVFEFSDQLDTERTPETAFPASEPAQIRERVPMPDGITVELGEEPHVEGAYRTSAKKKVDLRITRRWFTSKHIFLLFFAVFWNGFLYFWYSTAFEGDAPLMTFLFPLIHVAVGVGITYSAITGLLNRTEIDVTDEILSIQHKPLPWTGNRTIPVAELDQLFCERKENRGKNGTTITYTLSAVLKNHKSVQLLKGVPEQSQVRYIEATIEQALGIVDRRVPGES